MSKLDNFLNQKLAPELGCKPEEVDAVLNQGPQCYCGSYSHEGSGLMVGGIPLPTEAEHERECDEAAARFHALIEE
jgi:hypothetical protein